MYLLHLSLRGEVSAFRVLLPLGLHWAVYTLCIYSTSTFLGKLAPSVYILLSHGLHWEVYTLCIYSTSPVVGKLAPSVVDLLSLGLHWEVYTFRDPCFYSAFSFCGEVGTFAYFYSALACTKTFTHPEYLLHLSFQFHGDILHISMYYSPSASTKFKQSLIRAITPSQASWRNYSTFRVLLSLGQHWVVEDLCIYSTLAFLEKLALSVYTYSTSPALKS